MALPTITLLIFGKFSYSEINSIVITLLSLLIFSLITSGYLRENADLYSGFIEGGRTLEQYCQDEIEPMWKDCDHMSIIALVNALSKLIIYYSSSRMLFRYISAN